MTSHLPYRANQKKKKKRTTQWRYERRRQKDGTWNWPFGRVKFCGWQRWWSASPSLPPRPRRRSFERTTQWRSGRGCRFARSPPEQSTVKIYALLACRRSFSFTTLTAGSNPSSSSSSLPVLLRNTEVNGFRYRKRQEEKKKNRNTRLVRLNRDRNMKSINAQVVLWTAETGTVVVVDLHPKGE